MKEGSFPTETRDGSLPLPSLSLLLKAGSSGPRGEGLRLGAHPWGLSRERVASEEGPAGTAWRRRTRMWPGRGTLVPSCQPASLLAFPHRWDVPQGPDGEAQGSLQAALASR